MAIDTRGNHMGEFYKNLSHSDAGVRYWAIVGIFNNHGGKDLNLPPIIKALEDDSHHVRIMAAWVLYRIGMQNEARQVWNGLLEESSYASLKIFNIIDWIGDDTTPYLEAMRACKFDHGGYVKRMQEYMGVAAKEPKKKKRKNK